MSAANEKTTTWRQETEIKPVDIARRHGTAGGESEIDRSQQERTDRAYSTQSSIYSVGESVIGGTLSQMIQMFENQLAKKEDEARVLAEEIKEVKYRLKEFKSLLSELKQQKSPESE